MAFYLKLDTYPSSYTNFNLLCTFFVLALVTVCFYGVSPREIILKRFSHLDKGAYILWVSHIFHNQCELSIH